MIMLPVRMISVIRNIEYKTFSQKFGWFDFLVLKVRVFELENIQNISCSDVGQKNLLFVETVSNRQKFSVILIVMGDSLNSVAVFNQGIGIFGNQGKIL